MSRAERGDYCCRISVPASMSTAATSRRTVFVCGGFGLGSTREQDREGIRRLHDQLEPGGLLVLDNEVPYADAVMWQYWLKEKRQELP